MEREANAAYMFRMASTLRATIALMALVPSLLGAEKKDVSERAAPLETRVFEAKEGTSLRDANAPAPGIFPDDSETRVIPMHGKLRIPAATPLPPTADGEPRFDVLSFLKENGLKGGPGARAIWLPHSSKLILTLSSEDQDLAERIVQVPGIFPSLLSLQLVFSVWEYQYDPGKPQEPPLTGAALRERPGLQLLHSQTVNTRSGNRAISVSRLAGGESVPQTAGRGEVKAADGANPLPSLGKDRGAAVALEPVIGPDGASIDFLVEYEVRIASSDPKRDLELKGTTNATVVSGHEIVVQSGLIAHGEVAAGEQWRAYALTLKGVASREQDENVAVLEAQWKKERQARDEMIIERALKGLPVKKEAPVRQ